LVKRLIWVVAVVGCVLGAVIVFRYLALSGDLWVSNGTPLELEVSAGATTITVAAGANLEAGRFPSGTLELVARRKRDGVEIDRRTVVFRNTETHIYNVLGAAPVRLNNIVYSTSKTGTPPLETSLCGNDFLATTVDYVFTEPPSSIQMEKGSGEIHKKGLTLEKGGFSNCMMTLLPQPTLEAALTARLSRAVDDPLLRANLTWMAATTYARLGDAPAALALANPQLAADDTMEAHRSYQVVLQALGRGKEAREKYRLRVEAAPSAANAYLSARLLPAKEARALLEPWAKGDDGWVHRGILWQNVVLGDFVAVLAEVDWCLSHTDEADEHRAFCFEARARARVARGELSLALSELEEAWSKAPQLDLATAILIDRVAAKAGREPGRATYPRLAKSGDAEIFRGYYDLTRGGAVSSRTTYPGFKVLEEARLSPAHALELLDATPEGVRYVGQELAALLLGEALRTGQRSASRKLQNILPPSIPLAELEGWIRDGDESFDASDFDEVARAAFFLARGRRLESLGDRKAAEVLYRQVHEADRLDGLAVQAMAKWPPPAAANAGVLERVDGLLLERR
jgi:hypothetical protein